MSMSDIELLLSKTIDTKKLYTPNHSNDTRAKISVALKGKKHTEESRAKMSELKQGEKNNRYGIKHTAETRAKMRLHMRLCLHTKKAVQTPLGKFDSLTEAASAHNLKWGGTIRDRIKRGEPGYEYV